MIFQIIMRNVEWFQYLINCFLVIMGRSLDILSTRYVTKELKLETNKLARRLGWKGMIILQLPLIILGSLDFYLAFFIFMWSLMLFANNMEGSWYVRDVGEEKYQQEIKESLQKSKNWKIILGEVSPILELTFAGIFILVFLFIFHDYIAIFFICLALICQGLLGSVRSIRYLLDLKKENENGIKNNKE